MVSWDFEVRSGLAPAWPQPGPPQPGPRLAPGLAPSLGPVWPQSRVFHLRGNYIHFSVENLDISSHLVKSKDKSQERLRLEVRSGLAPVWPQSGPSLGPVWPQSGPSLAPGLTPVFSVKDNNIFFRTRKICLKFINFKLWKFARFLRLCESSVLV